MSRGTSLNVSLTPSELRRVRRHVATGEFTSASDVVREGLRLLFGEERSALSGSKSSAKLAAAYRACARRDREMADDSSILQDEWPEE